MSAEDVEDRPVSQTAETRVAFLIAADGDLAATQAALGALAGALDRFEGAGGASEIAIVDACRDTAVEDFLATIEGAAIVPAPAANDRVELWEEGLAATAAPLGLLAACDALPAQDAVTALCAALGQADAATPGPD